MSMTTQEINNQLYRPLQSGYQFDKFFPDSSCTNTPLANGNTKVAINEMAKWAKKYADHCKDIAPVLEGRDLEETVNNIQDFLYDHFQYNIDGELQNLKSPACAWSSRDEGMDCKSYSIFASCILLKLGIKHYLRRIKQEAMPDAFTHVYVVVPENQDTGKLNDGYFIIDGTIELNNEIPFIEADDIFMNYEPKLAIHGLAAPGLYAAALGCGDVSCGCATQQPMAMGGIIEDITGGGIDCIGGSAYTEDWLNHDQTRIVDHFAAIVEEINQAAASGNYSQLSQSVADFTGHAKLFLKTFQAKKNEGWNSCTTANLSTAIELISFYTTQCTQALNAWINLYFNKTSAGNSQYDSQLVDGLWGGYIRPLATQSEPRFNYTLKSGVASIKKFEINEYLIQSGTSGFNPSDFIGSITSVIATFTGNGNDTNGNDGYDNDYVPDNGNGFQNPGVQQAGMGILPGLVIAGIAAGLIYKSMNKKKATK